MRRIFSVMAAAAALFVVRAYAEEASGAATATVVTPAATASPAATAPASAAFEGTHVEGEMPVALAGTWLLIQSVKAPKEQYINEFTIYTIAKGDGNWTMRRLTGAVAPQFMQAIIQANKAHQIFKPSAAVLRATAKSVARLEPPGAEARNEKYTFFAPGHFPSGTDAPDLSDCKLLLSVLSSGPNTKASGGRYCFTDIHSNVLSGTLHVSVVALPRGVPPFPFSYDGSVAMYRLP